MARQLPTWFGPFAARPKLLAAALFGLVVALAAWAVAGLQPVTSALVGWDGLCLGYISGALVSMSRSSTDDMRARAAQDDQGRATILAIVLVAAVAAVGAISLELSSAKAVHGLERALRVALAFATVAASWFTVHLVFALHYAHAFYDRASDGRGDNGGLRFPGEEKQPPDYWDFLHFAVIVGVASQTADVAIASRSLRRLNTVHALFAFAFNTVIVALTINLLASLFG
jgi:uncharacterized membrane protein